MHNKKKYNNGQSRGGTSPKATDTGFGSPENKHKSHRDYYQNLRAFHGSDLAIEESSNRLGIKK